MFKKIWPEEEYSSYLSILSKKEILFPCRMN